MLLYSGIEKQGLLVGFSVIQILNFVHCGLFLTSPNKEDRHWISSTIEKAVIAATGAGPDYDARTYLSGRRACF